MTFTLAQITDLHMGPVPFAGPRYWNAKRLFGLLNWLKGRRRAHRPEVLSALVADMLAQQPDKIAVTGDLINIGLPQEHQAALKWLQNLGTPERIAVIPGNHDIYTRLGDDEGAMRWRAYMADNEAGAPFNSNAGETFPYVQRHGDIALIGLNSAMPTRPFVAAGRLGSRQRNKLADCLRRLGDAGLVRVVLIHHPPLPGQAKPLRALQDSEALADILSDHGAELVLHGHNHRNMFQWHPGRATDANEPVKQIPIVGTPSASMARRHHGEPLARYNLFRFSAGKTGTDTPATIEMIGRGYAEPGGEIIELERRMLNYVPVHGGKANDRS